MSDNNYFDRSVLVVVGEDIDKLAAKEDRPGYNSNIFILNRYSKLVDKVSADENDNFIF